MVNSPLIRPYLLGGVALGGYLRFPWYIWNLLRPKNPKNTIKNDYFEDPQNTPAIPYGPTYGKYLEYLYTVIIIYGVYLSQLGFFHQKHKRVSWGYGSPQAQSPTRTQRKRRPCVKKRVYELWTTSIYKVGPPPVISRVITPFIGVITPVIHL